MNDREYLHAHIYMNRTEFTMYTENSSSTFVVLALLFAIAMRAQYNLLVQTSKVSTATLCGQSGFVSMYAA